LTWVQGVSHSEAQQNVCGAKNKITLVFEPERDGWFPTLVRASPLMTSEELMLAINMILGAGDERWLW